MGCETLLTLILVAGLATTQAYGAEPGQPVSAAMPQASLRVAPGTLVGLNPQPEPPAPSAAVNRHDYVGLNPQPEPPSRPLDVQLWHRQS